MQVSLATAAARPDAPNEDYAAVCPAAAVLLDGAGIPKGVECGCSHGVEWFTRQLGGRLLAAVSGPAAGSLVDGLAEAIASVRSAHGKTCDVSHPASPSATVLAVRARAGVLEYLVLADSVLVLTLVGQEDPVVVCDDREASVGAPYRAAMDASTLGTEAHRQAFADYIAVMVKRRNKPGGFWVASAEPDAAQESLTGELPLTAIDSVLLLSDGAARLADRFGQASWPELVKTVTEAGPGS